MTSLVRNEITPSYGLLTIDMAAEWARVSRSKIEREIRKQSLPAVHLGHRTVRVRTDHLEAWIAERTSQPAAQA